MVKSTFDTPSFFFVTTKDASVIYSLIGHHKVAGVNFKKYLLHFLSHIHEYDNDYIRDLAELLPHNLKKPELL